ncbi:MAG: zinc ribbon domain-containing protein [Chloroflexaceae bacterium]|nr:zinc ribbon domain-containing protein [Chloroflexaceae bacterium]
MPMYEYACQECGSQFEMLRSIAQADTDTFCIHCGSSVTKRLFSRFAAFRKTDGGAVSSVAGNGCSGNCSSGSCSSGACGCSCSL